MFSFHLNCAFLTLKGQYESKFSNIGAQWKTRLQTGPLDLEFSLHNSIISSTSGAEGK